MRIVIAGNGVAGITVAKLLAEQAPDQTPVVCTDEKHPYYPRPKLIDLLARQAKLEEMTMYSAAWYEKRHIEVHYGKGVARLDPTEHSLELASGERVAYDRLVLAVGSTPFVPPLAGTDMKGVFALRTIDHVLAIQEHASKVQEAAIIGGGLLGLEAAHALHQLGLAVTVVENAAYLLTRQVDAAAGRILQRLLERKGLAFVLGASTEALVGTAAVQGVKLKDGRILPAGLVLFSTGVRCNVRLAKDSGLAVERGVVVDAHMLTSAPDVYALGDVAQFQGRNYGIIPPALDQARVVARNLVAPGSANYAGTIPSNTLKVVGLDLFSVGETNPTDDACEAVVEENPDAGIYRKLIVREGVIIGAIWLGDRRNTTVIARLVSAKTNIGAYRRELLAPDFDFSKLSSPSSMEGGKGEGGD